MEKNFASLTLETSDPLVCPFSGSRASTKSSSASQSPTETENSQTPLHSTSTHTEYDSHACPIFTQEVDPLLIKTSLEDRIAYLTDFLNFTSRDADIISKIAPSVHDVIPTLVDGMYAKLFEFDITKKVFMTRNQVRPSPRPVQTQHTPTHRNVTGLRWAPPTDFGGVDTGQCPDCLPEGTRAASSGGRTESDMCYRCS